MKKKLLSVLSLSLILALIFAISASAATPRWALFGSVSPGIDKDGDAYYTTISCISDVRKIEVSMEIYQKGLLGSYSHKDSANGTLYASGGTVYGYYDFNTSKTYRVDATVTATTASGQTETVTLSHTV